VTSVFKVRKKIANFTKFLKFVKIHIKSFFFASLVSAKFSNPHNTSSRLHWGNRWMGTVGSDDRELRFWQWGRQWSCRRFVDFVISSSWSCWTVDELTNHALWHNRTLNPKVKCCVCDNEFGGDGCDNLNFMNLKIDFFKFRKNSWILGTFKIHKIRNLNLW